MSKEYQRKILHLDMDYFYAQIEIRDNPDLQDKLVVVAKDSPRSVICTCSYNARKLGIHSGMSVMAAKKISSDLVFIRPQMWKYKQVHDQIIKIIREYSDIIEPVALDEAYIDVTLNKKGIQDPVRIAKELQYKIYDNLSLTCSIGVSYNKFLAKIGSDYQKPNGLTLINQDNVSEILANLPIKRFQGIGEKTLQTCYKHSIFYGRDLLDYKQEQLQILFGDKLGQRLYNNARGIGNDKVAYKHEVQSVSCEETLIYDINTIHEVIDIYQALCLELNQRLLQKNLCGQCVSIKIKYQDFQIITRSNTLNYCIIRPEEIFSEVKKILSSIDVNQKPIRSLGVGLSKLQPKKILKTQRKYQQILLPIFEEQYDKF